MDSNLVFHYTSIDALRSLIESVEKSKYSDSFLFRASNILYMNDPNEFVYGRKVFIRTLIKIEDELDVKECHRISSLWKDEPYKDEQKMDAEYIQYLQKSKNIPYVLSFSLLEDSLPMWLNYGNGGRGVCLAFQDNRNQPIKQRRTDNGESVYESFYTSDVHYDNIDKDSWLYQMLFDTIKDYKRDLQEGYSDNMKDAYFDALIQYAAPFIKTRHYMNEYEVRLSKTVGFHHYNNPSITKFRCNRLGNLIPYIDIEVNVDQLKYIIIGPLVDFNLTKLAIDMMADRYLNETKIDVRPSNVKYREY